jgi:hypothetical protein
LFLPPLSHYLFLFTSYLHQFSHHIMYAFPSPIRSMSNNSNLTSQSAITTLYWIIIAKHPSLWFCTFFTGGLLIALLKHSHMIR